ncbi:MAG: hypothetical protein FWE35_14775 [Streptosporangiales bacterium]|jgi:hypothetical protein|nr:hypothetical protein [Streptosporangiales bacterium]
MGDYQPRHASATNLHCATSKPHHLRSAASPAGDALTFSRRLLTDAYEKLRARGVDQTTLDRSFATAFASTAEGAAPAATVLRQPGWDNRGAAGLREPAIGESVIQGSGSRLEAGAAVPPPIPDLPGTDLRPDPGSAETIAEFLDCLRKYRIWAGSPSYRIMSRNCKRQFAPSTICTALGGDSLPGLEMVIAIVSACGGTVQHQSEFATAWRRLAIPRQETDKAAS